MRKGIVIGCILFALAIAAVAWLSLGSREKSTSSPIGVRDANHAQSTPSRKLLPQIADITDTGLHWEMRIQAVRDLPENLGASSTEKLFAFLKTPPASGEKDWYLVANEVMEVLRKKNLVAGIYTDRVLELILTRTADPMIRDYAAQHLAHWISGMDPLACEGDEKKATDAFNKLCSVASAPENQSQTLCGTTLNALADVVLNGKVTFQKEKQPVASLALAVIQSENASSVNRSTAIQVAAKLNAPELPQLCRELASSENVPGDVKLSSVAALGLVGDSSDIPFLKQFTSDGALQFAASAAVARLLKLN